MAKARSAYANLGGLCLLSGGSWRPELRTKRGEVKIGDIKTVIVFFNLAMQSRCYSTELKQPLIVNH